MEYLTTKELCDRLKISRFSIHRMLAAGSLKIGQHFLDIRQTGSSKACYRWKLDAVESLLSNPARKRAK